MEIDGGGAQPALGPPLAEAEFDIEAYAANYSGHARIDRLIFAADKSAGTPLELEALKLAAAALKTTEDTQRYAKVIERIGGRAGAAYALDRDWIERVDRAAAAKQDKLESDLSSSKANLVKESIRMGHNELGDFFYARGDLQNAFKHYMRTRDYCTTGRHIVHMSIQVVKCGLEMTNYIHVSNYVQKAEATPEAQADPVVASKLACVSGLYCLEQGRYKAVALKLTEVTSELGTSFNDLIAPQDVAIYGALCGMAALGRSELQARLVNSASFRELLELVPEMREALADFYASNYTSCLAHLARLRPQLLLDPHLHDHVAPLYQAVRNKALTQYTVPFSALDLNGMAAFFSTSVAGLEKELAALISSKQITARIDSHAKVLYARKPDQRSSTYAQAIKTGEEYLRNSRALLLRASIMQHDLIQKPAGGGGGGGPDRPDRGEGPPGRHGRHRERRSDRDRGERADREGLAASMWGRLGGGSGGGRDRD